MKCELCGRDYIALGVHVRRKHQVDPDAYREEYGLMKTAPLVEPELSAQLSAGAKARLSDPEYLAAVQDKCRENAQMPRAAREMSEAGKERLRAANRANNDLYLRQKASEVSAILQTHKTALDVRRETGMGADAVKGIASRGLAAYDPEEARREGARRAAHTMRTKALQRVAQVAPLLETTASAAEMCRMAGISIKTYKNWLAAGLIRSHPNGFGPRKRKGA